MRCITLQNIHPPPSIGIPHVIITQSLFFFPFCPRFYKKYKYLLSHDFSVTPSQLILPSFLFAF